MILIIAATDREVRPWLEICAEESGTATPEKLRAGTVLHLANRDPELAILCTGVGTEATTGSLVSIAELQPRLVLHVGLAGGLRAGINAGDIMMVTGVSPAVYEPGSGDPPPPRPLPDHILNPLRASLAELPDRMAQGPILTVSRFIDRAADKRSLGLASRYLACEMEAALVREAAESVGAVYVGLRGISDSEDHDIPAAPPGTSTRERLRFGLRMMTRPREVAAAARMLRGSHRATQALARAIPRALEAIEVFARA